MRRFFFTSLVFHGIFLLLLFSWEMPLADKLVLRNLIRVSLVEKAEEEAPSLPPAKSLPQPREERKILKRATEPPPATKDEKKEFPKEVVKEEKVEKEEKKPPEAKIPDGNAAPHPAPPMRIASPSPDKTETAGDNPAGEIADLKGGRGPVFTAALAPGTGNEGVGLIGLKGIEKRASLPVGDGSSPEAKSSPRALSEGDPVLAQILRRIEAAKRYPKAARKMGIEGKTVIRFKLKPGGQVEAAEILETSGSELLDKASLETVRGAAPLPFKEGWLKVGIVFKIN